MRYEHLVSKAKSGGLSLAFSPTRSLFIALLFLLTLPHKAASRAVPQNSQVFSGVSQTLGFLRDHTTEVTTSINGSGQEISETTTTLSGNVRYIVDSIQAIISGAERTVSEVGNLERDVSPSGSVSAPPLQETVESLGPSMLSMPQKIGIGVGISLTIICIAIVTFCLTKRQLIQNMRLRSSDGGVNVGEFSEVYAPHHDGWSSGGIHATGGAKIPLPNHIGSSAGSTEVDAWGHLSGRQPAHPLADVPKDRYSIGVHAGAGTVTRDSISNIHQKDARGKRRPADLQPLTLSAPPHRPFVAGSQAAPGVLSNSGLNSPHIWQGRLSTVSSKSSSTLGLTAFFNPGHGHERHGSASTRISHKSRKASTATMMTSNGEMEMATLSSASEPQFPLTPRDYDPSLSGSIYLGRVYRNSGYSCFDSEREEITPIKNQAHIPQSPSPIFSPPVLSSPSSNARSRHSHSRTNSSGINAANFINGIPSIFSTPKWRQGASPLAASAKSKAVRKEDIRVINHETTYFDDRDDEGDDDLDSLHSNLPRINSDKRWPRRNSAGLKRMSKEQADDVDGEEVWTDTDDEQDSDFVIAGGLGSRFGKKTPEGLHEGGVRAYSK